MDKHDLVSLGLQISRLYVLTSQPRWDGERALPLGKAQWKGAFERAQEIDRIVPGLPRPVVGADPAGFVWLTYRAGSRELALELRQSLVEEPFVWTTRRDGMAVTHAASDLRELAESLRATFGELEADRRALLGLPIDEPRDAETIEVHTGEGMSDAAPV
jgi:hypothetical protein